MILFSLPFAAVGVFMVGVCINNLIQRLRARDWVETQATIRECTLERHSSSDGDSYSLDVTYEYEVDGQTYVGDEVFATGMKGSSEIRQMGEILEQIKAQGKHHPCYYNPGDPGEAVLDRELSNMDLVFPAIFGIVFGGAGFGIMFFGIFTIVRGKGAKKQEQENPDEPWLWNKDWGTGSIKASGGAGLFLGIFAIFWNAISWTVFLLVPWQQELEENKAALLILLFPGIGVILLFAWLYTVLRRMKYGRSIFVMDRVPGVVGGKLGGTVEIPRKVFPPEGFEVTLRCIHRYTSGSGKNRSTHERTLWEDQKTITREGRGGGLGTNLPISFTIPYNCTESNPHVSSNCNLWRLEVKADTPGIDYNAKFEVPVFKTPDSQEQPDDSEGAATIDENRTPLADLLQREHIQYRRTASGCEMYFPAGRKLGGGIFLLIFCAVWTTVVVFLFMHAPIFFAVIFALFDLLIAFFLLVVLFGSSRITIDHQTITVANKVLGIGSTKRLPRMDIQGVDVKQTAQSGNKTFYRLVFQMTDGKEVTAGQMIPGHELRQKDC